MFLQTFYRLPPAKENTALSRVKQVDNGNVVASLSTQKSLETLSPPPSTDVHKSVMRKLPMNFPRKSV